MSFVLLFPVIFSSLLLGAHFLHGRELPSFLHGGNLLLMGLSLLLPLLLLIRRRWVPIVTQTWLLMGALEWVRTTYVLVAERQQDGRPWARLAVILGSVAAFTAASSLLFEIPRLRARYRRDGGIGGSRTALPPGNALGSADKESGRGG